MDLISIRDLQVETVIGVYDWEQKQARPLSVSLDMGWDTRLAARSDALEQALDYAAVSERVRAFCRDRRFQLIETLAEQVAQCIMSEFGVPWLRVRVEKRGAVLHADHVAVQIERGERGS
ncbi:MAG: dihydroneopterin aldolase [Gammaproteobacteria bacterium]|nr:MAG: dihydroneopterin aldolase [Gammaproteobacteria bacterium]